MEIFRNLHNWVNKNLSIIGIFIGIIGVSAFILHFGISINPKSVDVLTAIAVPVTVFFMYLAFNESRKNNIIIQEQNKILLSQSKHPDFKEEINELKRDGMNNLFSDWELKFINDKYQTCLPETNYINFFSVIYTFQYIILNDRYYQKYLKKFDTKKSLIVDADDIFDVDNLNTLLKILKQKYINERVWLRSIYDKYIRILTSDFLTKAFKKDLISELDELCAEFFDYCKEAQNSENNIHQLGLQRNEDGTVMLLLMKEYSELVIQFYKMINDIKEKLKQLQE
jgi:hypothetical protein